MARITPSNTRNALAVAKVLAPALIPVVTPFVIKSAGELRERWDRHRARRLGVAVGDLAQYSGYGGALHARISGAATALGEVRERSSAEFADETETRLRQLAAAVRAAERMPAPRRRAAHKAVNSELSAIEERLLHALGV